MTDVNAFFASRKNKSKKKKKKKTAVSLLEQEEAQDLREDSFQDSIENRQMALGALAINSDNDEWIDDDDEAENIPAKGFLVAGKAARDVQELDEDDAENKIPLTEQSEVIKTQFHMARKQALTAPVEAPKSPEPEKPKKWVVRAKVEHEA